MVRLGRDIARGLENLARHCAGLARSFGHTLDVGRHFLGAGRSLFDVAGDFLRGRTLLLDRRSNRGRDLVDLGDAVEDTFDRINRRFRCTLNAGDLAGDFLGGFGGLAGEVLHFGGDDREALAGFSGACGLDGCVQRQ